MYLHTLVALDNLAHGTTVKSSTIPHRDAGLDFFASKTIEKGKPVRYYYSSLVYVSLARQPNKYEDVFGVRDAGGCQETWEVGE